MDTLPNDIQSHIYKFVYNDVLNELPLIINQEMEITDEMEYDMIGYNNENRESYLHLYRYYHQQYLDNCWIDHLISTNILKQTSITHGDSNLFILFN